MKSINEYLINKNTKETLIPEDNTGFIKYKIKSHKFVGTTYDTIKNISNNLQKNFGFMNYISIREDNLDTINRFNRITYNPIRGSFDDAVSDCLGNNFDFSLEINGDKDIYYIDVYTGHSQKKKRYFIFMFSEEGYNAYNEWYLDTAGHIQSYNFSNIKECFDKGYFRPFKKN